MNITREELINKIQELKGMYVSLTWKGYGSAVFIELGKLTKDATSRSHHAKGEACIWLEWDWRAERNGKILFGSSNSGPKIDDGINNFLGKKIEDIKIIGETPELSICFTDGYKIQTMAMVSGDPQWAIRQKDSTYLSWENLKAVEKKGDEAGPELTIEEKEYINSLDKITDRIGRPIEEPISGNCCNCKYYVSIDGDYALLDYGVCLNGESKFDQHIVRSDSGCIVFSKVE